MPVQLLDSQGNPILGEQDPDTLTAEEIEALKAEGLDIPEVQPPEKKEEAPPEKKESPPQRNLEGETARLRNERNQLREARDRQETELRRLKEENDAFKQRQQFQREEAQRAQQAETLGQRPDPNEFPLESQLWDLKQEAAENKKMRDRIDAQERQQQEQRQQWEQTQEANKQIREFMDEDVAQYRLDHPEKQYDEAAKYVYGKYSNYWQRRGLNPQEVQNMGASMFMALGAAAKARGGSASEAVVELAEEWGYKPPEIKPDTPPAGNNNNVDVSAAKQKLERIKKGQQLQGLGGKTGTQRNPTDLVAGMTAEDLAALSDDEYVSLKQDKEKGKVLNKRLEELG